MSSSLSLCVCVCVCVCVLCVEGVGSGGILIHKTYQYSCIHLTTNKESTTPYL